MSDDAPATTSGSAGSNDHEDHYVVISSDGHCGGGTLEYKAYLESEWHEEFDAWAESYKSPFSDTVDATAKRNWDSDFRIAEQNADGITGEVLFPNTIPPFFETVGILGIGLPRTAESLARRSAGLRAHNRWLVDYCSREPVRRRGVVQVFPHDVDAMVEEIVWASEQPMIGGVLLPAIPPGSEVAPYFHSRYDAVWRVCEERNVPVCHHSGSGIPDMPFGEPGGMSIMESESPYWTRRTLKHLVLGGVFERFPALKYAQTEMGGLGWVVEYGFDMDFSVGQLTASNRTRTMFSDETTRSLSLKPSEYIRRNVYNGASVMAAHDAPFRHDLGVGHVMWGTDYPHESCSTPQSLEAMRWALSDIPSDEVRLMLGTNAAELYGFDLDALYALDIGPRVADVHQPLPGPELTEQQRRLTASGTGDRSIRPFEGGVLLARSTR